MILLRDVDRSGKQQELIPRMTAQWKQQLLDNRRKFVASSLSIELPAKPASLACRWVEAVLKARPAALAPDYSSLGGAVGGGQHFDLPE